MGPLAAFLASVTSFAVTACSGDSASLRVTFPQAASARIIDWRSLYGDDHDLEPATLRSLGFTGVILDGSVLADEIDGDYSGPVAEAQTDRDAGALLCELRESGIAGEIVIGAPTWADIDRRYLVTRLVRHIAENEHWQRCPPDVVYLDIEPYADGKDPVRAMDELADTVEEVIALDPVVSIGVFVPAWLPEIEASVPGEAKPFERIVTALRRDDVLAAMTYRGTAEGDGGLVSTVERFRRDLEGVRPGVRFLVGVETEAVDESGVSFAGSTRRTVVEAVELLLPVVTPAEGFEGVFVNSLSSYLGMSDG